MEGKKLISIITISLLVIVVAVLGVYVVFFKEKENEEIISFSDSKGGDTDTEKGTDINEKEEE